MTEKQQHNLREDTRDLRARGGPQGFPVYLTSFVGRDAERTQLKALVEIHRLVTLTGPGGCGKTRVAHSLGLDLAEVFPDGAWWVDLSALTQPELLIVEVARTIGIKEGFQPLDSTLLEWLKNKQALLIIDNCEHLVDACAALATKLLHSSEGVRIVATSREPLGIEGELTWRIPPLALRINQDDRGSEATQLFLDRTAAVRPDLRPAEIDGATIEEICRHLDGIPLAIELAAANMKILSPQQILSGISDRFRLLVGRSRTAMARHQTLRASVDWSFHLLAEPEKLLFRRLAVFMGSFSLEAVEQVCAFDPLTRTDVLPQLTALVEKSLVQVEADQNLVRYRMLDTIRQFAEESLMDSQDAQTTRDRHLENSLRIAREIRAGIESADHLVWLELAESDLGNVRAAVEWAAETDRHEEAIRILTDMMWFWVVKGLPKEGATKIEESLSRCDDPNVRAPALATLVTLRWLSGDLAGALAAGEEAVDTARSISESRVLCLALTQFGWTRPFIDPARGKELFSEAVTVCSDGSYPLGASEALCGLGVCEWMAGQVADALDHMNESLVIARAAGLGQTRLRPLVYIPMTVLTSGGQLDESVPLLEEAEEVARSLGDDFWRAMAMACHSVVDAVAGDLSTALERGGRAAEHAHTSGNPFVIAIAEGLLGTVEVWSGRDSASARLDGALAFFDAIGFTWGKGWCLMRKGELAWIQGDVPTARRLLKEAITPLNEAGLTLTAAWAKTLLGLVLREQGEAAEAADVLYAALQNSLDGGTLYYVPDTVDGLGLIAADAGRLEEALRVLIASAAERTRTGYARVPYLAKIVDHAIRDIRGALTRDELDTIERDAAELEIDQTIAYLTRGRGSRKRPASGWSSLTPTELDVVRLAAQGLTNSQIAKRLFVSPGTVKTHLSHVYAKLGMSNRAEVAAGFSQRTEAST